MMRRLLTLCWFGAVSGLSMGQGFESDGGGAQALPTNPTPGVPSSSIPSSSGGGSEGSALSFEMVEENFTTSKTAAAAYGVAKAPLNPSMGPTDIYVYRNAMGTFKFPPVSGLSSVGTGSANYRWYDNTMHSDQLTYIAHGRVTETDGYSLPIGAKISVWAFMSTDAAGNSFFSLLWNYARYHHPSWTPLPYVL